MDSVSLPPESVFDHVICLAHETLANMTQWGAKMLAGSLLFLVNLQLQWK